MMNQTQWMDTMLNVTRNSLESGIKTMENVSQQTKKVVDMTMSNANLVQEEARKLVDNWFATYKDMNKAYTEAVEEGLKTLEQQFSFKSAAKNK